jgi:hypothetical protein
MSWDQRAAVLLISVPLIAGWIATELTHALGWGVRRDHHR